MEVAPKPVKEAPSPPARLTCLILRSPSQQPRQRHVNLAPFERATGSAENKSAEVHGEFSQATAGGVLSLPAPPRCCCPHQCNPSLRPQGCRSLSVRPYLLMSQTGVGTVTWLYWWCSQGGRGTVPFLLLCLDASGGTSDWIQSGSHHASGNPFLRQLVMEAILLCVGILLWGLHLCHPTVLRVETLAQASSPDMRVIQPCTCRSGLKKIKVKVMD